MNTRQERYLLRDRVVDDDGLASHLRPILRVWQLGAHVQPEIVIPVNLLVTELNGFASTSLSKAYSTSQPMP